VLLGIVDKIDKEYFAVKITAMKFFFFLLFVSGSYASLAQNLVQINECIIEQGVLKQIQVDYNRKTGNGL
jgi:hypothetical protein